MKEYSEFIDRYFSYFLHLKCSFKVFFLCVCVECVKVFCNEQMHISQFLRIVLIFSRLSSVIKIFYECPYFITLNSLS